MSETKPCPSCGRPIPVSAGKCSSCSFLIKGRKGDEKGGSRAVYIPPMTLRDGIILGLIVIGVFIVVSSISDCSREYALPEQDYAKAYTVCSRKIESTLPGEFAWREKAGNVRERFYYADKNTSDEKMITLQGWELDAVNAAGVQENMYYECVYNTHTGEAESAFARKRKK